jgi:hypothetical protein
VVKTFKRPLGSPKHRWDDDCIHVSHQRDQRRSIINVNELMGFLECRELV